MKSQKGERLRQPEYRFRCEVPEYLLWKQLSLEDPLDSQGRAFANATPELRRRFVPCASALSSYLAIYFLALPASVSCTNETKPRATYLSTLHYCTDILEEISAIVC